MTYNTGGPIQALDYNTFATLAGGINEIYADSYSGATTLPTAAYGYGQPALTPVSAGSTISATQWGNLFQAMRDCGTHQGTAISPPVPAVNPTPGSTVSAFNTPTSLASAVALLSANKTNLAAGQTTIVPGTNYSSASSWTTLLTYTFRVNFSSWNNARYFFNSGGSIRIGGSYAAASTPVELAWRDAISSPKSPFSMYWNTTVPASGSNNAPLHPIGFWRPATNNPLTTSYQVVYRKAIGGGNYTSSYVQIEAKLANTAGTNGIVDILISLVDADPTPDVKVAGIAFQPGYAVSSGVFAYPGPAIIVTSGGFTYT